MKTSASPEITRITLQVLSLGVLLGAGLWILQPFIPSLLWAAIIVITTWPLFLKIQKRLWNRRWLAVTVMIAALALVVIIPCIFAIGSIVSNTDKLMTWAKTLQRASLPPPPEFLHRLPMVGSYLVELWQKATELTGSEVTQKLAPYTGVAISWFISKAGSFGLTFVQFLLTLLIAGLLYANGESTAVTIRAFARRLAGPEGEEVTVLAAKAVRGVALGVVLTALAQTALGAIGLAVTSFPSAGLLAAIMFMLCLAQIGPTPVLVPAVIWLYWKSSPISATVLLFFTIVALPLDNLLRPILIRKGADMPLFLVFAGVIGGLVALGIIGLFIGPVILAVAHTLLKTWVKRETAAPAEPAYREIVN